jgi:hypothetical protein
MIVKLAIATIAFLAGSVSAQSTTMLPDEANALRRAGPDYSSKLTCSVPSTKIFDNTFSNNYFLAFDNKPTSIRFYSGNQGAKNFIQILLRSGTSAVAGRSVAVTFVKSASDPKNANSECVLSLDTDDVDNCGSGQYRFRKEVGFDLRQLESCLVENGSDRTTKKLRGFIRVESWDTVFYSEPIGGRLSTVRETEEFYEFNLNVATGGDISTNPAANAPTSWSILKTTQNPITKRFVITLNGMVGFPYIFSGDLEFQDASEGKAMNISAITSITNCTDMRRFVAGTICSYTYTIVMRSTDQANCQDVVIGKKGVASVDMCDRNGVNCVADYAYLNLNSDGNCQMTANMLDVNTRVVINKSINPLGPIPSKIALEDSVCVHTITTLARGGNNANAIITQKIKDLKYRKNLADTSNGADTALITDYASQTLLTSNNPSGINPSGNNTFRSCNGNTCSVCLKLSVGNTATSIFPNNARNVQNVDKKFQFDGFISYFWGTDFTPAMSAKFAKFTKRSAEENTLAIRGSIKIDSSADEVKPRPPVSSASAVTAPLAAVLAALLTLVAL